jgi:hypothetical protein
MPPLLTLRLGFAGVSTASFNTAYTRKTVESAVARATGVLLTAVRLVEVLDADGVAVWTAPPSYFRALAAGVDGEKQAPSAAPRELQAKGSLTAIVIIRTPSTPAAAAIGAGIADPGGAFSANVTSNLMAAAPFTFAGASVSGVALSGAPQGALQASSSTAPRVSQAAVAAATGLPPAASAGVAVAVIAVLAASSFLSWREWRRRSPRGSIKVAPAPSTEVVSDVVDEVYAAVSAAAVAAERERAWSVSSRDDLHVEQQWRVTAASSEAAGALRSHGLHEGATGPPLRAARGAAAAASESPGGHAVPGAAMPASDEHGGGVMDGDGAAGGRSISTPLLLPPLLPPPQLLPPVDGASGGLPRSSPLPPLKLPARFEPRGPALAMAAVDRASLAPIAELPGSKT